MINLICPVCGERLTDDKKLYRCQNGHCFDKAKEGYVNLLTGKHKDGSLIGDNKSMAKSRKNFLEKEYFAALSDFLISFIKATGIENPAVCDICCGEGYYSDKIKSALSADICGFDISKEMVKLAAKRKNGVTYFVANLSHIPLKSGSIDIAVHLFAPFHEKEFTRIIRDNGYIITVVAGENHLFELKSLLYDTPYKNDEKPPETENLIFKDKIKITDEIHLRSRDDIDALFKMTPYYYHTSEKDKAKLFSLQNLTVTVDFAVYVCQKQKNA